MGFQEDVSNDMKRMEEQAARLAGKSSKLGLIVGFGIVNFALKLAFNVIKLPFKAIRWAVNKAINPSGKQSFNQLMKQDASMSSITLDADNIKDFEKLAKQVHIDYAVVKEKPSIVEAIYADSKGDEKNEVKDVASLSEDKATKDTQNAPAIPEHIDAQQQTGDAILAPDAQSQPLPNTKAAIDNGMDGTEPAKVHHTQEAAEAKAAEIMGTVKIDELRKSGEALKKAEIHDDKAGIALFAKTAKEQKFDFAIKQTEPKITAEKSAETNPNKESLDSPESAKESGKSVAAEKPLNTYTIYFKAKDTEKMNFVVKEYTKKRMQALAVKKEKPSIIEGIRKFEQKQRENKGQEKTLHRDKKRDVKMEIGA